MGKTVKRVLLGLILIPVLSAAAFLAWGLIRGEDTLTVERYHLRSDKVHLGSTIRTVVLSDLHNKEFGEGNRDLVEKIRDLSPDLILMAGDMVDRHSSDTEIIGDLCRELLEIAPVYYGLGNHESNLMYTQGVPLDKTLRELGVKVLINSSDRIEIKDTQIRVGSLSTDTDNYSKYGKEFFEEYERSEDLKLLIVHYPDLFYDILADADTDLAVAGHYHGGQVVLPLLGGLYTKDYGLFTKYCFGMFSLEHGNLFVSRGLGNHEKVPRINNDPQIAVIDINAR